jgi:hypothetical protein
LFKTALKRVSAAMMALRISSGLGRLGALALLVTACLMIMQVCQVGFARRNEWVVALAIACVLELYTAFRIPAELKKEE